MRHVLNQCSLYDLKEHVSALEQCLKVPHCNVLTHSLSPLSLSLSLSFSLLLEHKM